LGRFSIPRQITAAEKDGSRAILVDAYTRELRWRRRKGYFMFLSSIKHAADDEDFKAVLGRVLRCKDTHILIGSYL
jgi:hypothetical protein